MIEDLWFFKRILVDSSLLVWTARRSWMDTVGSLEPYPQAAAALAKPLTLSPEVRG